MPLPRGTPILNESGLKDAKDELIYQAGKFALYPAPWQAEQIAKAAVRAYLKAVRDQPVYYRTRLHETTKAMCEMEVGEKQVFPDTTKQQWFGRFKTCRKIMGEDVRFRYRSLGNGKAEVTRAPDGSEYEYTIRSPRVMFLASVPKQWTDAPVFPTAQISGHYKTQARKFLDNPNAEWQARTASHGKVQIRRIA